MRRQFQLFVEQKIAELERAKTDGWVKSYVLDIDEKTETVHVDYYFVPDKPIEFITLNFKSSNNTKFEDLI